jgi:thiol-disulfide isomerase/thioredoxin
MKKIIASIVLLVASTSTLAYVYPGFGYPEYNMGHKVYPSSLPVGYYQAAAPSSYNQTESYPTSSYKQPSCAKSCQTCPKKPEIMRPLRKPEAEKMPMAKRETAQRQPMSQNKPQVSEQSDNLIIFFTGDNCPYCDYMKPIMQQAQQSYNNDVEFKIINVTQNPQYATKYGFSTVPQIFYFKNNKKLGVHGSDNKTMTVDKVIANIRSFFKL